MTNCIKKLQLEINILLQAVLDGKTLQFQYKGASSKPVEQAWQDAKDIKSSYYQEGLFIRDLGTYRWRVKPEPKTPKELFINVYPDRDSKGNVDSPFGMGHLTLRGCPTGSSRMLCRARYVLAEEYPNEPAEI